MADGDRSNPPIGGGNKYPPGFNKDMLEPLIFPKSQLRFQLFTTGLCTVIGIYMVFWQDFGPKDHVFKPVRKYKDQLVRQFFRVDPEDQEVKAIRSKLFKKSGKRTNEPEISES